MVPEIYEEVPEGAVVLSEIRVIEFIDPSDLAETVVTSAVDECGEPLDLGKILYLLEWMRAIALAPLNAHCVSMAIGCDCPEEDDDY